MKDEILNSSRRTVLTELNEAFKGIVHNHRYLNKLVKHGEDVISSAEWLLDNIYLIEKEYKTIKFNLPINYFNNLPTIDIEGVNYPRVYALAKNYIEKSQNIIEESELIKFINDQGEIFTIGELWAFPLMLRVALIINLGIITNDMVVLQKQRLGAKDLANTVIDSYSNGKLDILISKLESKYPLNDGEANKGELSNSNYMGEDESLHDGLFSPEFIDKFFNILRDNSIEDERIYKFALDRLKEKENTSFEKEILKDHIKEGNIATAIGITINSLRIMDSINWKNFFAETSNIEKILKQDPADIYNNMDFETKDYYRHKIEEISRKTNIKEIELVKTALELSSLHLENKDIYKKHIGYYLVDDGIDELLKRFNINKNIDKRMSKATYLSTIFLGTILIDLVVLLLTYLIPLNFSIGQYILAFILMIIPSSEVVISLLNWFIAKVTPVSFIPRMDYSEGVPDSERTIVVIPAILSNSKNVIELLKKLEIYYLANRDKNIFFALLGDLSDSSNENEPQDKAINDEGIRFVNKLNKKYVKDEEDRFFFLNRKRLYNDSEGVYMGYERKRGKLMEFMALIRGSEKTTYNIISSDIESLKSAKYIITLDSDTFLPIGSAKKLIGAMGHILNTPYIEDEVVVRGYSIMQPKVGVNLEDKHKTYFSEIFAGDAGVDAYSTASSDTYQDLFGEGIFTGKGILEIDTFYNVLKDEIPENRVLSHDLIEGIFTRCALLTDVEVIDGYPSSYLASALRLHRWVRGDWQIGSFAFSKKISIISKWKIIDNLRRSLLAPSLLLGLIAILTVLSGAVQISVLLFLALITPLVFTVTDFVVTPKNKLMGTFKTLKQILLILSFTPYQAWLMFDAIFRTIYRLVISKKNLLQWKTADRVEKSVKNTYMWYYQKMWISVGIALVVLLLSLDNSIEILIATLLISILWAIAPAIACRISKEEVVIKDRLELEDEEFLRESSRRIWAYYEDFVNEENNYLAPDNFQEKPFKGVAHRTSPTNIGMGLITNLTAYDLGYTSIGEVIYRLESILDGMRGLEKYNGHYLNWYDTKTKEALWPRYVSTVDSGNLLGYLWIIKETIRSISNDPIIREKEVLAIKDTYSLIRKDEKEEFYDGLPDVIDLKDYKNILLDELKRVNDKLEKNEENQERDKKEYYWIKKLKRELETKIDFYDFIFDGIEKIVIDSFKSYKAPSLLQIIDLLEDIKNASGEDFKEILNKKINKLKDFDERLKILASEIDSIMEDMDFKFLYNENRGLFAIGYNVEEKSLGNSYYDLMASEARIASFLAIARGEVPRSHWYNLSRNMTKAFGQKSLVSWSGTMFEYFMPFQIMKDFKNTIWDLTYSSVVNAQKIYGEKKSIPWGISESAYYEFDVAQNYQYKAFGVPGIGLKRGLEQEIVVSPYSSIMTLPYDTKGSIENLRRLYDNKAYGRYGFIEAIDYSEEKVKDEAKEVRCYMVHHLGMSLLALDNVLNNNILKERFHSIPEIKAVELLLKEKIPQNITFEREVDISSANNKKLEKEDFIPRIFKGSKRENPEVVLLSNGSYSTMVTDSGSGYSKKDDMTVYRWKGDSTSDSSGMFFYIKNLNSNDYWSATYEPCKEDNDDYLVEFTLDKAKYERKDGNIKTNYEVTVACEDNVEIRKLSLKNTGEKLRTLEITSYLEVTLQSFEGDAVHPSFSNLFISTEYDEETKSLIGNRRPRAEGAVTHYIFHTIATNYDLNGDLTYETSRLNFIGRNRNLKSPEAMDNDAPLQNTVGTVLDPIMSMRATITLNPGEEKQIYYLTGVGESKEEVLDIIRRYKEVPMIEKSADAYNYSNQLELKHIGIRSAQANIYQSLASYILYLHSGRKNREDYIRNISMNQESLWAYGISGDLPIILLVIEGEDDIDLLRQVINMHYYFRNKGIKSDLIIYNEEEISYEEPLQKNIISTVKNSLERENINKSGGIFIHNKSTMGEEIKNFIVGISKLFINSLEGTLASQLTEAVNYNDDEYKNNKDIAPVNRIKVNINESDYIKSFIDKEINNDDELGKSAKRNEFNDASEEKEYKLDELRKNELRNKHFNVGDLDFFNGYGGFDKSDKSYVIRLKDYENTPAPWINVISNKDFGFHISEVGSTYTWCGNSRENKITPWSNDWVIDPTGEALYIRDNTSGAYFTITPMPIRDGGEYIIKHSFGFSTFKHTAYNIRGEMKVFCPQDEKIKLCKISLKNLSNVDKSLSLFYYAQLVLGVYNYGSAKYISTHVQGQYIYGQNPYSKYFGKLKAYLSINGEDNQSFTGDRKSFLGVGEDLSSPEALLKDSLNNVSGSIYDPCLAASLDIELKAGEEKELVIIFGEEENEKLIQEKINKYSNIEKVDEELENVKEYWSNFLGNIQVKTPDASMDYMLNGWLMYQTLSCRYLSRTAFYQSGGAYGFRDQLQDSMSIGILNPTITREQILRSASRQYLEGDVQHWWHPVINSGIRTRFSDDLLWLPYVTIEYIKSTGDYSILDEEAPYLEDEPLRNGEDERYTIVNQSNKNGTIYEHCLKAIDRGLKFGEHNIPLMGSGDWNDGMSTVGNKGKGESVWVGWFLYKILAGFKEICNYKKDNEKEDEYNTFQEFIRENLEKNAWDGGWYRRAYFDDGTPLGSRENDECKIDSLSQSWSIISNAAKLARAQEAMEAVDRYLVDKDKGLIKLLAPPFDKSSLEPGYIKGYVAGVRENGGQYTHAAVWVILALTKLGLGDKAWKYYNMINPINHSNTELEARSYKVEPYVMAADVYIKEPHGGRGGWSWYTGASGWMYKVGLEDILGLKKIEGKGYKIEPCIPEMWNEYDINIKNETEDYKIKVKRGEDKGITINGEKANNDLIPKGKGSLNIEVVI
ncbi:MULTISPECIES: GH36-type glycosyl hydrolase domain-containing protein [Clostridium]|uniref:GH36-type glycosyl hydrolase domain-containing protein n=1 Tax=Clostridium TaxID=1485 RepID=UPI000C0728C2|nr:MULTISPECIES: glucoamylase family protein [Clostridium]MDU2680407.1 glucoamylase family protein [Clostridium sp.]